MSRGKKTAIGIIGAFVLLCGAFMLFVNWSNSDSGQAAMNEVGTKQAIESAAANAQATLDAGAAANASGTATAVMTGIDARIQNAQLIFEDGLDEGSPFIKANMDGGDLSYENGIAKIYFAFSGFDYLQINKSLSDFIAEADCAVYGKGVFCGFAYGINESGKFPKYYASVISGSYKCGFFNHAANLPSDKYMNCNYPQSTTAKLQRLRLEKFGGNIRFYVNGELMDERVLENNEYLSGDAGLYYGRAGGENSELNDVYLDNFKVWEIP